MDEELEDPWETPRWIGGGSVGDEEKQSETPRPKTYADYTKAVDVTIDG